MTDSNNRPDVTPAYAAQSLAMRPLYNREAWERALLASNLPANAKLVGLALAHLASDAGYLPAGRIQSVRRMGPLVSLAPRLVRISKNVLGGEGFIRRPHAGGWTNPDLCRPITLTLRPARSEPPHTGEQP